PSGPREPIVGPDAGPSPPYPVRFGGQVIKGFGRGSKELGIPTANIPLSGLSIGGHDDLESGIYYGWAALLLPPSTSPPLASDISYETTTTSSVEPQIYPMVMSIGWNPFYKNTVRSVEVHIIHEFAADFYGADIHLVILGYIRPEYDYVSKESLIDDIKTDIEVAKRSLGREAYERYKEDGYLRDFGEEE
ncbi:riboflavin kinase, partial [Patellaria atrata CBS 101060]